MSPKPTELLLDSGNDLRLVRIVELTRHFRNAPLVRTKKESLFRVVENTLSLITGHTARAPDVVLVLLDTPVLSSLIEKSEKPAYPSSDSR